MAKKIVAISGYSCCALDGSIKNDMKDAIKETFPMDKEIVCLTGKSNPNFLLLAHAQPLEKQEEYFIAMKKIYSEIFNCNCKILRSDELIDKDYVQQMIDWADIIYEGGGNTLEMIKIWKDTGFDKILEKAWNSEKVMCGLSAGANCWFSECITDALRIKYGPDQPLISMECLQFQKGFLVAHCDEEERHEDAKELLKNKDSIAILLSNCTAIEIIDDKYRIITSKASYFKQPYAMKLYCENGKYIDEQLDLSSEFKSLDNLYTKKKAML